ncbi:M4 family metallopeptidase [Taibaiella helva]|uniref:M4 family metallopeptidase n=1 Tax=Taibaiella helva TaxID=2301235 RepID=UPI0018E550C0|nr:M4 family metallopeptidase [Taibaiella helva]
MGACLFACPSDSHGQEEGKSKGTITEWNRRDNNPAGIFIGEGAKVPIEDASTFLATQLSLIPGKDELRLVKSTSPYSGITVQRYEQWLQGIKVEHGGYTVTARQGLIASATGDFYNTSQVNTDIQPALSEAQALNYALRVIGAKKYAWEQNASDLSVVKPLTSKKPEGTKVWIEDRVSDLNNGRLYLAYKFIVQTIEPLNMQVIYIDAVNGNTLFRTTMMHHVLGTGTSLYSGQVPLETKAVANSFILVDDSRGGGIFTYNANDSNTLFTSTSNSAWAGPQVDVHWASGKIYDYWKTQHNRSSYNDLDSPLINLVHFRQDPNEPWNNAAWTGSYMVYGDGTGENQGGKKPLVALDVCAHEIGHGICQNTANLVYERESGALNEGFSDIWGAVVEAWADPHEQDNRPKNRWLIGEELATRPMRSMQNPKEYRRPDTYLKEFWIPASTSDCPVPDLYTNDQCGVHYNSGVLSHWFYLLTEGGSGTNDNFKQYTLTGIGMEKAAKIAYLTELSLSSNANYGNCRTASISAAKTLYGNCSAEFKNVVRAWYAVGVGGNDTSCDITPTSVANLQSVEEGFKVLNNPFQSRITIRYNIGLPDVADIRLIDASGRVVYKASPRLPSGKGDYTLDLSTAALSHGWYMLRLITSGQMFSEKLIKN